MPVEPGPHVVLVQDLLKTTYIFFEVIGTYGGILDECKRATGATARGHEKSETGLSDLQ
jgi:hypothetical protein